LLLSLCEAHRDVTHERPSQAQRPPLNFGYQFDADLECKKSTIHLTLLKASEAIQSSTYGADASTSQQDESSPMGSGKSTTPQTLSDE
jgi:hypothetical protein